MEEQEKLQRLAEKEKPQFQLFYKKNKKRLAEMDDIVHQLHNEASAKIDCLTCANCCKTLGPAIYSKDIDRMAKSLRIKTTDFIDTYLRIDEDKDYVFRSMPCPFLMPDNRCYIYQDRPKACREYPHTDRKKFEKIYQLTVTNASTCPIAYEVLMGLKDK